MAGIALTDCEENGRPLDVSSLRSAAPVTLREICFLGPPRDCNGAELREAQVAALVGMVPLTISVNVLAAVALAFSLWPNLPKWQVLAWLGSVALFCLLRLIRSHRLRHDRDYARRKPSSFRTIIRPVLLLTLLWTVPALAWIPIVPAHDQIMIALILLGIASGASVTLSTVPPAALTYVVLVTGATMVGTSGLDSRILPLMLAVFGAMLSYAVLWNARQFVGHLRARIEVEEQAAMIRLLREFEASGSDWLWELDADLKVTYMSRAFVAASGLSPSELIGANVRSLLDPDGAAAEISAGMCQLFDSVALGVAFREVTVPVLGGTRWWVFSGQPVRDPKGRLLGWRGVGSDATTGRRTGRSAIRAARHDPLTGLGNRLLIRELIEESLLQHRAGRGGCALLLVDLDRFKLVNDTLGHSAGDQLLCAVADRLRSIAGRVEVGRLGGDEFAIVDRSGNTPEELGKLATRVIACLSAPYAIGVGELRIGATIGIAHAPTDGSTQEELTRHADLALYRAKEAGRLGFQFFEPWMAEAARAQRQLENDLRSALLEGQLSLAYQPIVDAVTSKVVAREALLRWNHPERGAIPPDVFVPVIEDSGLIGEVGKWVIREACREGAEWEGKLRLAVNVSAAQLTDGELVGTVIDALTVSGFPAERLELEVTESVFLADDPGTRDTLARLRGLGVRLVLDDFGMGYSSLASLARGEFGKIKIDRSFVAGAGNGRPEALAIVEAIIALGRSMRCEVTAEGVERDDQAALMRALGCDQLQGYLFGRPEFAVSLPGAASRSARRRAA